MLFDDILVYSASLEDHTIHLQSVLELLRRDQWQVKRSKCSFAQRQLSYLGHTISQHGVATETPKIKNIANWSSPQSVKEVRSFLGLAGYYRRFVHLQVPTVSIPECEKPVLDRRFRYVTECPMGHLVSYSLEAT